MQLPEKSVEHFNDAIYYPMLLAILARDREAIEVGEFKFKRPYLTMIEQAENQVREDFKKTYTYFRQHEMKLKKLGNDGTFTEYEFIYQGDSEKRRYLNIRLRNHTEELLGEYFRVKEAGSNVG